MNGALCAASGLWIGDCFIYTNGAWRLNYCVGGEVTTMFHLDRPMYLLGYLAAQSKVYLIDKVSCILWVPLGRSAHLPTRTINTQASQPPVPQKF